MTEKHRNETVKHRNESEKHQEKSVKHRNTTDEKAGQRQPRQQFQDNPMY